VVAIKLVSVVRPQALPSLLAHWRLFHFEGKWRRVLSRCWHDCWQQRTVPKRPQGMGSMIDRDADAGWSRRAKAFSTRE